MQRAQALRKETALDSISPERAGGIMYDTLSYINKMQLLDANPILLSKIYSSVEAMEADTAPVSDITGKALRPGQVVVIVTSSTSSPDYGVVYRYNGIVSGASSWTAVGKIGSSPYLEGYLYAGIATPATDPQTVNITQRVFYRAVEPGTYTNFGGIVVNSGEVVNLKFDGSSWSKEVTGEASAASVTELEEFDNNLGKTFEVINGGGLTPEQIGLIADIYVVGNIDIPVGGHLGISYVTLNNSNIGGTGKLGFQFSLNIGGQWSRQANCYVDATEFEPGKLYKFDSIEKGSTIGALIDEIYVRTSDTFVWPSDDVIKNTQIKITEFGYGKNVQPFYLASINRPTQKSIITVGKGAGYDYNTLTGATNAAPNGSVILVYPGVYENECITAGTTKTLYIIGIDRDKCVIKNNLGAYQYAVIHIASGLLRNLTVIQEGTDPGQTSGAYGVHADFNPGQNSTLRIENCHLQSNVPNTGGIGIGLRKDMHLTIKGCRLVSGTSGRALYAHDDDGGSGGAQYLHVIDCILDSPNQAILIQGQGKPDRDFSVQQYYIEFCRNIVKGTISFINWYSDPGTITADDLQGVKNLRLLETSWGNSAGVLNNPGLTPN